MIRKAFSRARKALTGAAFGIALAVAPAPAHAFWDTSKAWNDLLQFAVKQVNAPGEFEIILGEVTKPEDGFALISTLQIKDSDGIWFDASNLLVDWSPTALIRGRFTFETLSAEQISILRAPIGRGDPPAEDGPDVAFAWPRPPVPIAIDVLKIDRLRIEGGLLPQDLEASVEGAFSDIGDVQDAELTVQRTDRPGDRITLKSRIDFDDLDIEFALNANEEPGGLVAQMASLPPDQALELDLAAEGTPENLPFELFADIGQIGVAKGKGVARWDGLITARFDGTVEPGEETNADWKRALGRAAEITVDFEETAKGTYDLKVLEIDSDAFELNGKGVVDVGRNEIDMALDWDAKDIAAFNQLIAPASVAELKGTVRATGVLTAPKLDVDARVGGLDASFGKAEAVQLKIDSRPIDGERGAVGKQQGFDFRASATGLALADAGLQDALGPTPTFSGEGKFDGIAQTVDLDILRIEARSVTLDGSAQYAIPVGRIDAQLAGQATELGPFFAAAGLPIDGRANLAFKLKGLQGGTLESLFLNAQMSELSSDDPDIAAALGEEAILEVLLAQEGEDTIRVERGSLESEVLTATASGTISIPGDTVDLAVDFDLSDAAAVTALIDPARVGSAEGKATLTGTLSEPKVAMDATATGIGFQTYAAETARIEGSAQYRKDRRAPFSLIAELDGVTTGDADLDRVVGSSPEIETTGLYDTATGLLSLDTAQIDLADADIELSGDINPRKQILDVTYDLDAGDLSGFAPLVDKPLAGSVDLAGTAKGPFTLPFVTAKGNVRDLVYDTYSVEAADLDIEMASVEEGPALFRIDVTATNPKTGDPDLDALIGDNPSLDMKGTLDRAGPAVVLDYLNADLAALKADARGSVDLGTRLLELSFDVQATELDGLQAILGTEIAGSVIAKGTASGSFTAPAVNATIDGKALRYDTYSIGSITGDIDVQQAPSGFAPFDIDIEARDVKTGDPALDDLLVGASTVKATGEFDQTAQKIRIESADIRAAGAEATLSGDIDIAARMLDVDFDIAAENLAPFEPLVGTPLTGSVSAKGSAAGTLAAPQVDVTLDGAGLRYGAYSVGSIKGDIDIRQADDGFAPFDVDVEARDVKTGDPALDDLLAGASTVKATGAFNQSDQKVRIESADLKAAGADVSLSGDIDIAARMIDVEFDIAAENLAPFEPLVGTPLAGAVSAKGSAAGTLRAPQADVTLDGADLRYGAYSVSSIKGDIDIRQADDGFAPFDIDVEARDVKTGDPALDDLLTGASTIVAKGAFNQSEQKLRIESSALRVAGADAILSGDIDIAARMLDVDFDIEAETLAPFEPLVGVPLAGSVSAKGSASGTLTAPQVDMQLNGKGLRYDTYSVAAIDGTVDIRQATEGFAPFDIDVKARGIETGDPALDDLLEDDATIRAKGGFDQSAKKLRLDSATLNAAGTTASASGTVDLDARALDLAFDLDAADLSAFSPLVGVPLDGAVTARGTAAGTLAQPQVDVKLSGKGLRYDAYSARSLEGSIALDEVRNGYAPFSVDVKATGLSVGDPALDEALAGGIAIDAAGGFDREGQRLRLDRAALETDAVTADLAGAVNLKARTLDLRFDVDADDLAILGPLIEAETSGALTAKGTAKGSFSLPAVNVELDGKSLRYDAYRIASLDGTVAMDPAARGLAPFDIDVTASGIRTGDAALDDVIGGTVAFDANGAFDRAKQLVRLDAATLGSGFADAEASGTVNLKNRMLDIAFDFDARRLAALRPLIGTDIAGSVALKGTAKGPLSLPAIDATLAGRDIAYDRYTVARLDGRVDMGNGDALPFDIDLGASGIGTGDPALDAALGESVSIDAKGRYDRAARRLRLDAATLDAEFATATASGNVDLAARTLDIAFDLDAERLGAFAPLAGADLGGALKASGTARGAFVIPSVDITVDGRSIRYAQYSIGSLTGDIDVGNAVDGALPFDVDLSATDIATGDPALDGAIGRTVRLDATGTFDRDDQVVTLDAARFDSEFANATAQGAIDLKSRTLDVAFDLTATDLSPVGAIAGAPVSGSVAMRGTARGPFNLPAIDANLAGRDLGFDAYGARALDGSVSLGLPEDGFAPFSVDLAGEGLSLGDPALDAAFGARLDIDATGAVDIAQQRIRLDRAALVTDAATVAANGSIDLTARQLDIAFDVEAGNLAGFGPLAGADLGGALAVSGRATGPFVIPRVNARIDGTAIRYEGYSVGRLGGTVEMDRAQNGVMPFTSALTAAGIGTGNPALDQALGGEVRVAATGDFDQTAKRLTLDEASIDSAIGRVGANGTVDLGAKTLDIGFSVDAGDLNALSGLAGADIGGALAMGGRVTGPFSAPSVATTLDGRGLRYAQYSVASLNGRASFAAVPEGYGPFDLDLAAAGIGTGDPSLDAALADGISVAAKGGFDLANQRLRLDSMTAQARFASVSASGLVDLKARSVDVNFALDASDLSPLSAVVGKPLGGALRASGSARGDLGAPVLNVNAQGGGLYYDSYSLGGLSLDLKMPGDAPGYLPFALNGTLSQPRLNNPQIEALIGETVTLRADGVFDPTRRLLRLTGTEIATASARVNAFGDVDLANSLLDVQYFLDAGDLSVAQSLAGKTLAGAARVNGRVVGALSDPSTTGRLTGQNLVYDTYRVTTIEATYDLQRLVSGPTGSVALDAQTEFGPLVASARFDLTGGTVRIDEVQVSGLGLGLEGSFRTGPGGMLEGSATFTAADLARIGGFIGQPLAGQINGTATLNGDQGRQNAVFDVAGNSLRYGPPDDPTVLLAAFTARGQVFDAFGANPYIDATVTGSNGKLAGFPLKQLDATAKGSLSALDANITASGGALGSDKVEAIARLNLVTPPRSAVVSRLAIVYDGRQASIIEPLVVEEIPPGGFRIRGLDLRAEDGELRGGVEYTPSGLLADLRIRNFPLSLAALSGVDVIRSGRLDGTVDIDTRGGVRGNFSLEAYALRLQGAQIDDPFSITAKGTMDGTALNASAELTGAQLVRPLTASARIPLISTPGSPLPMPDRNAPFTAQVDWEGDVGEIWAFVPLPDHILTGPVVIRGRAGGTLAAPMLSGGAVLNDGRYSNIEFGTLLTNLTAKADFTQDGRAVFELSANDGVEGTVTASGSYVVANGTLDSRLSLNNAALVRRDDATAILSGDATAVSQGRDIAVKGSFRTNYVELRLIGNLGGGLTVVEAIPVGKSAPLYVPPPVETKESRRIRLDVSLSMPNRVFVRGRGLDSEWGGQLKVAGTASKPRINGEIERRRGVLDFLGKQFELAIGIVRFTGNTSPFVQVRLQRDANDIVGWIEVIGTVPDVAIEFGSIPDLPEGEVLPRLLFGRSKQSLTALEAAQLAAGVATLLSGKAGVLDSVRDAVGVDVLRVESDIDGGTSIITGKYLRDEVFVGAKQNLQTGNTSGLVEVEVFDQFELEAELGSEEAKGSVGWQIEY